MTSPSTIWPDISVPEPVKSWLQTLYSLVDSQDASVPEKVADLYREDAIVYGMSGKSEGREAIIQARQKSWDHMETRKHQVLRVYTAKQDGSDLLIIGNLTAKFKNGKEATDDFIAQIVLDGTTSSNPKGTLYKVWADSAVWTKAIRGE